MTLQLPADCDLAVNPSPGGEDMRPAGATEFLGGAAYALIRSAIVDARELVLTQPREAPDRAGVHRRDRPRRHR